MNSIAFYIGSVCVTRHGILMGLGVLTAVISAVMLRRMQNRPMLPVLWAGAIASVLVPLMSRIVYWYCLYEQFDSFWKALVMFDSGGYSMVGAVCGLLLSGFLAVKAVKNSVPGQTLSELYDCILPSGVLGTAVGRLAGLYDTADKGRFIIEKPAFQRLPFSVPVADVYTGEVSYRLAVFMFESAAAFAVYAVSMVIFRKIYGANGAAGAEKSVYRVSSAGVAALAFFIAAQCVFDSMKYDALFLRSNGFVCLMQIFGAAVLVALAVYSGYLARKEGAHGITRGKAALMITGGLLLLGNAGYMEYYVQRHGNLYLSCYAVMITGLVCAAALIVMPMKKE